jgi:hypothetical protein
MTMNDEGEVFGRIKMGVNVDIKRSDGKANLFVFIFMDLLVFLLKLSFSDEMLILLEFLLLLLETNNHFKTAVV